ncbi:MAG: hypothetical protein MAG453_00903 [Calditrichaeota bacterium]|nr:hypothetical protein [Calditrichota bacterium]
MLRNPAAVTAVALLLVLAYSPASAQEGSEMTEEQMEAMMKEYNEMMQPGEHHERLDYFTGGWDISIRMWMAGKDQPPTETTGDAHYEWVLGGRFLHNEASGKMDEGEYHGMGAIGYDTFRNQYVGVGLSNTSTAIHIFSGVYDEKNNAYVFFMNMDEPMTGEVDKVSKVIFRIEDENHFTEEVHDMALGLRDTMVMELMYTRRR